MMRFVGTLALLAGCAPEPAERAAVAFYPDVQRVLNDNCVACHQPGYGPFPLDDHASVAPLAARVVEAVETRVMPPWPADPECRDFEGRHEIGDAERRILQDWLRAGTPEGDPALALETPPSLAEPVLGEVELEIAVPSYVPEEASDGSDDWRCFLHDVAADRERYIVASEVVPGSSQVHHVEVYALEPADAEVARASDAEDPEAGWSCEGNVAEGQKVELGRISVGVFPERLARWAPGQEADLLPAGTAYVLPAGAVVVTQVHYSLFGGAGVADDTLVRFDVSEEPPTHALVSSAISVPELHIPAGDPSVAVSHEWPYYGDEPLRLRSVSPHMHMLGTSFRSSATSNGEQACLVDVPAWSYAWQPNYVVPNGGTIDVASGGALQLTCTYDNSAANQPFVDGSQQEPRDVGWGESATEEMCFLMFERVEAFGAAACDISGGIGTAWAVDGLDASCLECTGAAVSSCAPECVAELEQDLACAESCLRGALALGANADACLRSECADAYDSFRACVDGQGDCADPIAACGSLQ